MCNRRRGPSGSVAVTVRFPARKVPQPRSTPSRAKSQAVPEENASRVLPRALRKTSPTSADDMASDFLPCLGTSCGRRERVHTALRPAGTVCGTCPPLPDRRAGRGRAGAACAAWEGQGTGRPSGIDPGACQVRVQLAQEQIRC